MGVRGLTKYIDENSKLYLQPYKLYNTYLVVDGNNVAAQLYRWLSKSHSAFGGDYDEFYKTVADFFNMLNKCNVTCIVLIDGGYEKKKIKTLLSRSANNLAILRRFSKGFNTSNFFPLLLKQTFIDVMNDMNIICVQCDFEADIEIAAVARVLNCPVLSYDSDFYIFDVLYIPFSTAFIKPVKFPDSNEFYVRCSIFNVTNFLEQFSGLDKSHLPIIATLLGNDYIKSSLFEKFFGHVSMSKNKKKTYTQRRIHGVLNWLKKETVESATNLILTHLENKSAGKVLHAIESSTRDYTSIFVSGAVLDELKSRLGGIGGYGLKKKLFNINLPKEIKKLYSECKIHTFIVDMISLGIYFTKLQVENVQFQSSHITSLPLIKNIYSLLTPYMEKPNQLKLYLTVKNYYGAIKVENDPNHFLNYVNLDDILKESKEERLKWLCSIVGIEDDDLNIVPTSYWSIFLMSFIYWVKKLKDFISLAHVQALILMVIANEVVQKYTGYFRNYSKFMKSKGAQLGKLKVEKIEEVQSTNFNEMLENVTLYEKLHIQSVLLPYRQTTEKGSSKAYDISVLHLFGCFQSCLFHIMQLNALLNYPLPHLKVCNFYSGTLLFNFYVIIKTKPNFGNNLFKETPNLGKIFTYLNENFSKFLSKTAPKVSKSRKKKKKKNKALEQNIEELIYYEVDDENFNYVDENNFYTILKNV